MLSIFIIKSPFAQVHFNETSLKKSASKQEQKINTTYEPLKLLKIVSPLLCHFSVLDHGHCCNQRDLKQK
jgi:hypothetical protein